MKKILITGAILSLLSAQVFAQDSTATAAPAAQPAANTNANGNGSSGSFLNGTVAGVSTGTLIGIGAAIAFVAVAASDDKSATSHSTTTHH
jgi:predicted lipid-binding transport protein (Tim44 family)